MRFFAFLFVGLCFSFGFGLNSQAFEIDDDLPVKKLNEESALTVLNARLGSRFSLSFVSRDGGFHTGLLGYDNDEFSELLIQLETAEGAFCMRTSSLPEGAQYLKNQTMRVGMTGLELKGETPAGIVARVTIVSPFTPSESLADSSALKTQIAPVYYLMMEVFNESGEKVKGKWHVGFDKVMTDHHQTPFGARIWKTGAQTNAISYRDNVNVHANVVLSGLTDRIYQHQNISGFNVLANDFQMASGDVSRDTLFYAGYYDGKVIDDRKNNQELNFYYTAIWKGLDDVVEYALKHANSNLQRSARFENILTRSGLSSEEKGLIALAFRSDIANAFLLKDPDNDPRFYLAEGRFRHLSTIDVAHETELMAVFAPWRLKLQLEQWLDYMAVKKVDRGTNKYGEPHYEGMSAAEYGPYLYHDVGDLPFVSETSDYWFGPHMAVEENTNYTLLLYWYWKLTGDDEYVKTNLGILDVLLYSVMNRDTDGNGIVDKGMGWSTYDNAEAIKRSPENVFLGVKQMSAYLTAAEMFRELAIKAKDNDLEDVKNVKDGTGVGFKAGTLSNEALRESQAKKYTRAAENIINTLKEAHQEYGYIPCSLDESFEGWDQHSIVLSEGLFLPGLSGFDNELLDEIMPVFKDSYQQAFEKSKADYGIKLSSEEEGTWFSKVMVSDIVAGYWFDIDRTTAHFAYDWNKNHYYAYNDGVNEQLESWIGFWYPRGVQAWGICSKKNNLSHLIWISF